MKKNKEKQIASQIIETLKTELKWCKDNDKETDLPKEYKKGFKKGIKQCISIVRHLYVKI